MGANVRRPPLAVTTSKSNAYGAPAVFMWADGSKLAPVLLNLLANAIKFTPAGGRVTVALTGRCDESDGSAFAGLAVADTGVGISADKREAIVDPFV